MSEVDTAVIVQFSHAEAFISEFQKRPPNVEPLVRINAVERPINLNVHGDAVVSAWVDLYLKATFLRLTEGVLQIVQADHFVGQLLSRAVTLPVGQERPATDLVIEERSRRIMLAIEDAAKAAGLEVGYGSYVSPPNGGANG